MSAGPFHLLHVSALPDASGMQSYSEDMERIRAALDAAPAVFPWWTAALLVMLLLAWCAALTIAWNHLPQRRKMSSDPKHAVASQEPEFQLEAMQG
jgi:hypothetical protein